MYLAQGPQRSDAGEARTRGPSALSQALYHWATALPWMGGQEDNIFWFLFRSSPGVAKKEPGYSLQAFM